MHLTIERFLTTICSSFQSALEIVNVFEHGENIIFAVHLTHYIMYLPFIESNIKITTYIYRRTNKFPA